MSSMAHPTGVQQSSKINGKPRLTGTLSLTGFRRDKSLMANPDGASDASKMKAPEPAATGSRACVSNGAGNGDNLTRNEGVAQ